MKKMGLLAAGVAALVLGSGCGEEKKPPVPTPGAPAAPAAPATGGGDTAAKPKFDASKATETISGTVKFDGDAPKVKKVLISGDAFCEEHNKGDQAAVNEGLLVDATSKGIMNAFVYVKSGPVTEFSHEAPAGAVQIDQHGCVYKPHVVGAMAKQKVKVGSDDDTKHNVHWVSKLSGDKNETSTKGSFVEVDLKRAELGAYFKCDIHSWMQAYVCVSSHPFFAVTDKDGKFTLPKLPAGEYEIGLWHESLGESTTKVKVEAGKAAEANFTLKAK